MREKQRERPKSRAQHGYDKGLLPSLSSTLISLLCAPGFLIISSAIMGDFRGSSLRRGNVKRIERTRRIKKPFRDPTRGKKSDPQIRETPSGIVLRVAHIHLKERLF